MRISVAALLLLLPLLAFYQSSFQPKPIEPKKFAVMAWGDSPSDADQLRGMQGGAACGRLGRDVPTRIIFLPTTLFQMPSVESGLGPSRHIGQNVDF
jgi:hypothetical protein